ncbi:Os03g0588950 [Oryza sativa Japonica Group]|uniref:Os03g0588950 protein n=1 Tax=Oryza sativa subsp. japonica TaxID=39947 RepID=A0A0P0VZV1_ORYSJ|nr:Os03g0588950 [Oryza sativa Japonica Group]
MAWCYYSSSNACRWWLSSFAATSRPKSAMAEQLLYGCDVAFAPYGRRRSPCWSNTSVIPAVAAGCALDVEEDGEKGQRRR